MVGTTAYGWKWSLSNIAGSVVAQTSMNGTKIGSTTIYDPFGNAATALPNNRLGTFDAGWLGTNNRFIDQTTDFAAIPMGARLYIPIANRFTQVDPVLGGCANDYTYGDPIGSNDVSGMVDPCAPGSGPMKTRNQNVNLIIRFTGIYYEKGEALLEYYVEAQATPGHREGAVFSIVQVEVSRSGGRKPRRIAFATTLDKPADHIPWAAHTEFRV